jgi:hypothetical protein
VATPNCASTAALAMSVVALFAPGVVGILEDLAGRDAAAAVDRVALAARGIAQLEAAGQGVVVRVTLPEYRLLPVPLACAVWRLLQRSSRRPSMASTTKLVSSRRPQPHLEGPVAARPHARTRLAQSPACFEVAAEGESAATIASAGRQLRARRQLQCGALRQRGRQQATGAGVGHEVAADHRQAGVAALEAHVFAAVGVDDHVTRLKRSLATARTDAPLACSRAERAGHRRVAGIGGGSGAAEGEQQAKRKGSSW